MESTKRGPGQPKWHPTKLQLEAVKELARIGADHEQMASSLKISKTTFYRELRENPQFMDAITEGETDGAISAMNAMMEMVKKKDFRAIRFYLEHRGGRNYQPKLQLTGANDEAIQITEVKARKISNAAQKLRQEI